MNAKYTVKQVASLHGVATETARQWAVHFKDYLSVMANPGGNKTRYFTSEDMAVFDLIARMKNEGKTYTEIEAALQNDQRGESPELSPDEIQTLAVSANEQRLGLQIQHLQMELERSRQAYQAVMQKLELQREIEDENERLKERVTLLTEELDRLREQVKGMSDQRIEESKAIGKLEAQVEMLKELLGKGN